jgi:4-amino-4-deoxy-L-arabinose transferase-like glycosyltransferase
VFDRYGWIRRWLWIIIAIAVLLRILAALYLGDQANALPGTYDEVSYDTLALRVLTGHGFTFATSWWPATKAGEPTAHWSFLYTLYLAGIYGLVGHHPLVARLIQAIVVGVFMPWLVYRLGRRLFTPTVGIVAALIITIYAYFIYYAASLMTESFYITGILWVFDTAFRLGDLVQEKNEPLSQKRIIPSGFNLGIGLAITVLLRQVFLLFIPVLFLWLLWISWQKRYLWSIVRTILIATAILVLSILPWTVRNYQVFRQFVLLNTNAGYVFFWANHPAQGTHFAGLLPSDGPSYQDLIPPELMYLNEAALERALLKRGLAFVAEDPIRYFALSLGRIADYFWFWPSAKSSLISNLSRVLSFGVFLPFMLVGLILSRRQWPACSLLYIFVAVYAIIHIFSWTAPRYRLPVDAVLIIFAGLSIVKTYKLTFITGPKALSAKRSYVKSHS